MADDGNRSAEAPEGGAILSAVSLARQAGLDPRAQAVLEKQAHVLDLQIRDIERDTRVRQLTLRFGAVSAAMKAVFEVAFAFIVVVVAVLVAAAIWKAAHDDAIVIEAFVVPPDLTATGLTGEVVASQLGDRLAWIDEHGKKGHVINTLRSSRRNDIKVQIPNTGISISEAFQSLAMWLGHQTDVSGEIWHDGKGIALAVRVGDAPAKIFHTSAGDVNAVLEPAAEYVHERTR